MGANAFDGGARGALLFRQIVSRGRASTYAALGKEHTSMRFGLAASSLLLFGVACVTERVIVVKDPAPGAPAQVATSENNPVVADPTGPAVASDEPDWGIKDPSDSRE